MATKSIDKKKTLEYAVAFYFYDSGCVNFMMGNIMYQHIKTIYDERADSTIPFNKPVYLSKSEVCNASTFPQDYDFCGFSPHYICGMSVPPVMMAQVATRVYEQWLSKL